MSSTAPSPSRTVFRPDRGNLVVVGILFFLVLWPALYWPLQLGWALLLPIGALVWLLRVRTVVDDRGIVAIGLRRSHAALWKNVDRLGLPSDGSVVVHPRGGTAFRLPGVSFRDLGKIARASGGAVSDPGITTPGDVEDA